MMDLNYFLRLNRSHTIDALISFAIAMVSSSDLNFHPHSPGQIPREGKKSFFTEFIHLDLHRDTSSYAKIMIKILKFVYLLWHF